MSEQLFRITFFSASAMFAVMVLGLVDAIILPGMDRWSRRFFTVLFSVLVLCMMAYLAELSTYGVPDMMRIEKAAAYSESLLASLLLPMTTILLLYHCGEDWKSSVLFRIVAAVWFIYFVLLNASLTTNLFFHYEPENLYQRGPLYRLMVTPLIATMLLNLESVIRRRNRIPRKIYYTLLASLLPLTAALLIHLFVSVFLLLYVGVCAAAISMYIIILQGQIEEDLRQQREIAHQRASIMVLQMRPHFIYNTMTSIYYLCDQDAQKARQVTMDFTTYLRKNFTAIASEAPIPFTEELEHARAYLAVEQAQFEESISVEYDTPHLTFRVPPLTLQPIVENCVKHGRDPDGEPLHIRIQTRKTNSGSELLVEDNGPGYHPEDDDRPHIALKNLRERLEMMCGGTMTIRFREEGGTEVRITIPDQRKEGRRSRPEKDQRRAR